NWPPTWASGSPSKTSYLGLAVLPVASEQVLSTALPMSTTPPQSPRWNRARSSGMVTSSDSAVDDGVILGAIGEDLAAAGDDEAGGIGVLTGLGLDHRAGLDVEGAAVQHVDEAVEDVLIGAVPVGRGADVGGYL